MGMCGREACEVTGCNHQPLTKEEREKKICACGKWVLPTVAFPYMAVDGIHDTLVCTSKENANSREVGGDHYLTQAIQPWDYIHRNGIGFLAGSVIKYVSRYKAKGGVEDLEKAKHFIEKLIEEEQRHAVSPEERFPEKHFIKGA